MMLLDLTELAKLQNPHSRAAIMWAAPVVLGRLRTREPAGELDLKTVPASRFPSGKHRVGPLGMLNLPFIVSVC